MNVVKLNYRRSCARAYGTPLERFIAGGVFILCGIYILPQNYQASFFMIGLGVVFLMSISTERRKEFTDFFWEKFKRLVDAIFPV